MVPEEDFKEEQLLQWWLGRKTARPQDSVPTVIQYGDGLTFYLSHVQRE
jgi:hypothetical protein